MLLVLFMLKIWGRRSKLLLGLCNFLAFHIFFGCLIMFFFICVPFFFVSIMPSFYDLFLEVLGLCELQGSLLLDCISKDAWATTATIVSSMRVHMDTAKSNSSNVATIVVKSIIATKTGVVKTNLVMDTKVQSNVGKKIDIGGKSSNGRFSFHSSSFSFYYT